MLTRYGMNVRYYWDDYEDDKTYYIEDYESIYGEWVKSEDVETLEKENEELKKTVVELSLENMILKGKKQ